MSVPPEARTRFFFGGPDRQLYGCYHSPQGRKEKSTAVLICSPLGAEYDQSHPTVHQLANQLARAGYPVLRFNYFGTGNSGGEANEVTVAGLLADTRAAAGEVCARAQSADVIVVGIRTGATLAAGLSAYAGAGAPHKHVLWDGFLEGQGRKRFPGRCPDWTRGYGFSRSFIADFLQRAPDAGCALGNSGHTLVLQTDGKPDRSLGSNGFVSGKGGLEFKAFPGVSLSSQSQVVPYKAINYIVQWIAAG